MIGTINCVYETPCGWCSKWDKKCDRKIPERKDKVKQNTIEEDIAFAQDAAKAVEKCKSECDHQWECTGIGTAGTTYMCKKCYAQKTDYFDPVDYQVTVTI